ncbi:MAG: hypothetical protein ACON5B_14950 [Myxococcota bacterium]
MSSESQNAPQNQTTFIMLLLSGGMLLGFGILNLYFSFGLDTAGVDVGDDIRNMDFNQHPALVGFNGFDNITMLDAGFWSLPCIIIGAILMVVANATAWEHTEGGY